MKRNGIAIFRLLAGLALLPVLAVAQTAAELKAELQGFGFQNSEEVLDWLLNSDHEGPFHMVNMLKFHGEANYPEDYEGERGTGLDAQRRYTETIVELVMQLGIRPVVRNQVIGSVGWLGENEDWDMITINYYPDRESFFKLVRSETYKSAGLHKHAALERTMTIVTLPGGPIVEPAKATGDQASTDEATQDAAENTLPVTVSNFVRAESDHMFRANMAMTGVPFGKFAHLREPTTPDNQPIIRMNQDTLYSATMLDLSEPVTITLPEIGGRYMSMHVVNQDHYSFVEAKPGSYHLTQEKVGTRFAMVTIRTFYNAGDPDDLAKAHAAQDQLVVSGGGSGPFEAPNWDTDQLAIARQRGTGSGIRNL